MADNPLANPQAPSFQARREEMDEIYRLREIEEIKALRAENERRVRKAVLPPSLSEQTEWGALPPMADAAVRSMPIIGPISEGVRERITSDEKNANLEKWRAESFKKYPDYITAAGITGAVAGSIAIPSPAAKMGGITGSIARVGESAAVNATDELMRGGSPLDVGIQSGLITTGVELARPKLYNRIFGGIPDEMQDFYSKNRKAVNSARSTSELGESMTADAKRVQQEISQGSGQSFKTLRESGVGYPLDNILSPIDTARQRIAQMGAFGKGDQALMKELDRLGYRIMEESNGLKTVDPEKVKSFITAFRNATQAYKAGKLGLGHPAGQGYTQSVLKEADAAMDKVLKDLVPEYAEQMKKVSAATRAIKPLQKTLSDETKATHYIKRLMRGSDPAGMKILKDFDEVARTNYATELPAAYTKEFLERPNIHGSRQVNAGKGVGKAIGGDFGEAIGGLVGAGQDIYARKIGKMLMDISALPGLGTAGRMLNKAALKSPYAAMATYRFLRMRDQAFSSKMDEYLQEEEEP